MKKYLIIILALILIIVPSSAFEFGTMTYDTEKIHQGNTSFSFALFNMGDEDLNVELQATNSGNTTVYFDDRNLVLEPNKVSKNPSEGWLSAGPNRYVEPREIKFDAYNPDKFEQDGFQIRIEASLREKSEDNGIEQDAVQVRTLDYSILPIESEERPEVGRGYEAPEDREQDIVVVENNTESQVEADNLSSSENESKIFLNSSEIGKSSQDKESTDKTVNKVTIFLLVSVMLSFVYLWRIL